MKQPDKTMSVRQTYNGSTLEGLVKEKMSVDIFQRFSELIQKSCGIKMPEAKKEMLESRLRKRLRELGIRSFGKYWDYLSSDEGMRNELGPMIDVVTTNKTGFFREDAHFDYLYEHVLPALTTSGNQFAKGREIKLWSAGCSTGEEPYTLAMVLEEFASLKNSFKYRILATDISNRVLDAATRAVYSSERAKEIPDRLMKKYIMKSRDRSLELVRIVPELRKNITFARLNFFDNFDLKDRFDIVFCRNVIIYFERERQRDLLNRICNFLVPGGYLFTGHSETLHAMGLELVPQAPSVYRKPVQS